MLNPKTYNVDSKSGTIGAKEIYEYNGKKYKRVPTKPRCLGCDLLDEEIGECCNPEKMSKCMELAPGNIINHFQFKEVTDDIQL